MGLGMAAGSRAHLEETALSQRSWYRNLLMHGFHFLVLLVAGGAIKDTQCGFKVRLSPSFACALHNSDLLKASLVANMARLGSSWMAVLLKHDDAVLFLGVHGLGTCRSSAAVLRGSQYRD